MITTEQMELYITMVETIKEQSDISVKMSAALEALLVKVNSLEARIFELECQMTMVGPTGRKDVQ